MGPVSLLVRLSDGSLHLGVAQPDTDLQGTPWFSTEIPKTRSPYFLATT